MNFLALGITGYFFIQLYHGENVPNGVPRSPTLISWPRIRATVLRADAIGSLNLMIWLAIILVPLSYIVMFKTPIGLRIRAGAASTPGRPTPSASTCTSFATARSSTVRVAWPPWAAPT